MRNDEQMKARKRRAVDAPAWLLDVVVRRMPSDRGEWGAAMLAELAYLQLPWTRWRFAWAAHGWRCFRLAKEDSHEL